MADRVVMRRRECDEDEQLLVGEYRQLHNVNRTGKVIWATIRCPDCKLVWSIGKAAHTVDEHGVVSPSVVCAGARHCEPPCPWHVYVQLQGWEP